MVDEEELSIDDILEEERSGRLTARVGDTGLNEDNGPPSTNEPDLGDEDT